MEQMKAVTRRTYGGPEQLAFEAVPVPKLGADDLLLRVQAASLNMADWHIMTGAPWVVRPSLGLRRPRSATFGSDVAGVVEAVGPDVTDIAVGDRVFGISGHGFAEVAPLRAERAAHIPDEVSFEQAAALPIAGVTALQAVTEIGQAAAGDRVLVNGGSGGVGHLAVQIAHLAGAEVTAVTSARNLDFVRGLGAAEVIDYATTDYTTLDRRYDLIVDVQGNHRAAENLRVLSPDGRWVIVGGPNDSRLLGPLPWALGGLLRTAFSSRHARMFIAQETRPRLEQLATWVAAGQLTPHVERTVPLSDLPPAMGHLGTGRTRGKQLIQIA